MTWVDEENDDEPLSPNDGGCIMAICLVVVLAMGGALGLAIVWAIGKAVTR